MYVFFSGTIDLVTLCFAVHSCIRNPLFFRGLLNLFHAFLWFLFGLFPLHRVLNFFVIKIFFCT